MLLVKVFFDQPLKKKFPVYRLTRHSIFKTAALLGLLFDRRGPRVSFCRNK
jgi:hypothetical protein